MTLEVHDELAGDMPDVTRASKSGRRLHLGEYSWIWLALVLVFVASAIFAPGSVQPSTLVTMLPFAAALMVVSVGQGLVIQQRGIDLSVVGIMALGGTVVAYLTGTLAWGVALALGVVVVAGAAAGSVNAALVTRLSITPLVATLATNALVLGFVIGVSGGNASSTSPEFAEAMRGTIAGVPAAFILAIVIVAAAAIFLNRSVGGRRFVAVGANPRAARAAGIAVDRYLLLTYVLAGISFAVAGAMLAGFIGIATPEMANSFLLPSVAAVVLGGTPLSGGRGSLVATAVAALFLAQLESLVLSLGANEAVQLLLQAIVLVLAIAIRNIPFARLRSPRKWAEGA